MSLYLSIFNNKYIEDYDKNKESSYRQYWDAYNLYGWEMSQNLPVKSFKWVKDISKFGETFIKSYNEESDKGYFLEVDVNVLKIYIIFHNDLPFCPQRMKIEKVEKPVANLHDKTEYVIQIRNLKQVLNHGLVLKKLHRVIKKVAYCSLIPVASGRFYVRPLVKLYNLYFHLNNFLMTDIHWRLTK